MRRSERSERSDGGGWLSDMTTATSSLSLFCQVISEEGQTTWQTDRQKRKSGKRKKARDEQRQRVYVDSSEYRERLE